MKKLLVFLTIMIATTNIFSQSSNFSVGVIGSHFHNDSNENKISEADNPYGYGLVISKGITKDFSIALTGEYMQGDLKSGLGEEKDLRFHFTGIIHPFTFDSFQPYLSGGFVYTHRNFNYDSNVQKSDDSEDLINGRVGMGVNVPILKNLFVNGDLGIYTDGYGYVGWGSNLGIRIGL